MQSTSFQSVPCASPEAAAASAAAMAALAAPKGMEHKILSTVVQEVNGLFIAIVVVELTPAAQEEEAEQNPGENRQDEPIYGKNDAPGDIYWLAGFNARQLEEFQPFPNVEPLPYEQAADFAPAVPPDAPAAPPQDYGSGLYTDAALLYLQDTQTASQAFPEESSQAAAQLRADFNEAPHAAPAHEIPADAASPQFDPGDDDEGEGEDGGGDGKGSRRDLAENTFSPAVEEPAPAPPA